MEFAPIILVGSFWYWSLCWGSSVSAQKYT